ncbi:hypothetical protein JM83_3250 [Gillisia sp. Hel_I_86]|uniref:DUF6452 family protein n=1 Tax=Gillisia sp. Hel_I_86 TaxID=1249981 RepID=UPI00119C12E1|nr:DUF6452 family protein [Gillisia sp. Hel_I_86]TVZ28143.1 hypothetical protein JM83_3250 [Gillisia sp. Hel_I_86]
MFGKKIKFQNSSRLILGMILLLILNLGCQRDDICSESTLITPLLKISFLDFDANTEGDTIAKPVTNLSVRAEGDTVNYINRVTTSEISIPLRTDVDATSYEFILNARDDDDTSEENIDIIDFTYTRNQEYINRACSFRVTYINLTATVQDETPTTNKWIKRIKIEQPTVEDETTTHISIFH